MLLSSGCGSSSGSSLLSRSRRRRRRVCGISREWPALLLHADDRVEYLRRVGSVGAVVVPASSGRARSSCRRRRGHSQVDVQGHAAVTTCSLRRGRCRCRRHVHVHGRWLLLPWLLLLLVVHGACKESGICEVEWRQTLLLLLLLVVVVWGGKEWRRRSRADMVAKDDRGEVHRRKAGMLVIRVVSAHCRDRIYIRYKNPMYPISFVSDILQARESLFVISGAMSGGWCSM